MGNRPAKMDDVLNRIDESKTQSVESVKGTTKAIKRPKLPPPDAPDVPRFDLDSKDGLDYLEEHGFVVFKDVLSTEEVEKAKDMCWKWIEALPYTTFVGEHLQRDNIATWITEAWPGDSRIGLVNSDSAGQSDFVWYIRGLPRVKEVFSRVWDDDELLVSFDGFSMFRPWSFNPTWKTGGGWYHVDQNAKRKPNRECVQGIVTLYDVHEGTGGLTVIPDSHKLFKQIAQDIELRHRYDYVTIPKTHDVVQKPGIIIKAKAGDCILWDSRTIHCNSPALETPRIPDLEKEQWELLRIATYICMTPKSKVDEDDWDELIDKRKWAVENYIGSTHWPHEFNIHGGRGNKGDDNKRDWNDFNEQQKSLIGLAN